MKILILTCNTGQGHNASAKAIQGELVRRGAVCDIADTLAFLSKKGSRVVDKCFTGIYRKTPKIFDVGYAHAGEGQTGRQGADCLWSVMLMGAGRLHRYVEEGGYTHIVCVHIFSAVMVTAMKEKYGVTLPTSFLSTDYTCYPFVELTDVDLYFLPHGALAEDFVARGIPRERLIATGIPVRGDFLRIERDKAAAREALGLPKDAKVVFLMGGSMGCGPMEKMVKAIAKGGGEDIRLLVSCGTNRKLLRSLQRGKDSRITAFRYTENVPQIMAASDLFVTKPGGISITEAGVMGLPMLLLNVVGGCETPNYGFFTARELAAGARDVEDVASLCARLLADGEGRHRMSERLLGEFRRDSAALIADHVLQATNVAVPHT